MTTVEHRRWALCHWPVAAFAAVFSAGLNIMLPCTVADVTADRACVHHMCDDSVVTQPNRAISRRRTRLFCGGA